MAQKKAADAIRKLFKDADVEGCMVPLIVSGEIKSALDRMGAAGTRFDEV